jgi:hypothetical protein
MDQDVRIGMPCKPPGMWDMDTAKDQPPPLYQLMDIVSETYAKQAITSVNGSCCN